MRLQITQLWSKIEILNKTANGSPLELAIRNEDQTTLRGHLAFSRGGLHWKPAKAKKYRKVSWELVIRFLDGEE